MLVSWLNVKRIWTKAFIWTLFSALQIQDFIKGASELQRLGKFQHVTVLFAETEQSVFCRRIFQLYLSCTAIILRFSNMWGESLENPPADMNICLSPAAERLSALTVPEQVYLENSLLCRAQTASLRTSHYTSPHIWSESGPTSRSVLSVRQRPGRLVKPLIRLLNVEKNNWSWTCLSNSNHLGNEQQL